MGIDFYKSRFVVAHTGGGISVTTVDQGLITDSVYNVMTPERMGDIQTETLSTLCFSGKYTKQEMDKFFLGAGGFVSYMGTSDAAKVEEMALAGDEEAMMMYDVMAYQLSKAIAAMITVVESKADAVIITGALARSELLLGKVHKRIDGLGQNIVIIPGELEMEGLAGGALNVLNGEEEAKEYTSLPKNCESVEDFYRKYPDPDPFLASFE